MPSVDRVYMLGFLAVLFSGAGLAQERPEYSIREDQPRTGSHIRQDVASSTSIPINLPYEKLSPEEQSNFHSNYESIAAGDEPPFPRKGLRALLDPIRKAQAKLRVRGDLFLVATIGPDGKAREVAAFSSPSPEMTQFAAQVLMLTPFKPAICSGNPCAMDFPLKVAFRVE